jgi:hypothetical protein
MLHVSQKQNSDGKEKQGTRLRTGIGDKKLTFMEILKVDARPLGHTLPPPAEPSQSDFHVQNTGYSRQAIKAGVQIAVMAM